jgi:4-oxalocrotonate tautomerase
MPLVNVKLIEGVFSEPQKREIVEKLTEAMVEIEGENMRPVTWVVVEEVKSGDWYPWPACSASAWDRARRPRPPAPRTRPASRARRPAIRSGRRPCTEPSRR